MKPEDYIDGLHQLRTAYELPRSTLFPVSSGQIAGVESELGRTLPRQYHEFLAVVGSGDEFLSYAHWYGFDPAGSAHILVVNEYLRKQAQILSRTKRNLMYPTLMLTFFSAGHDHYGFNSHPSERQYQEPVLCWNRRSGRCHKVAATFNEFLAWRFLNLEMHLSLHGRL